MCRSDGSVCVYLRKDSECLDDCVWPAAALCDRRLLGFAEDKEQIPRCASWHTLPSRCKGVPRPESPGPQPRCELAGPGLESSGLPFPARVVQLAICCRQDKCVCK